MSSTRKFVRLIIASAAIACCIAMYLIFAKPQTSSAATNIPDAQGTWQTVKHGDFEVLCREEGELRPVKVTALQFLRMGKISFLIPEGTNVKKGDRIVSLETKDLEEEVQRLQEDFGTAEKALAQQEQTRDLDTKRLRTELQTEKERAELARLREHEILTKPLPLDKEEAKNQLDGAKARLENATAELAAFRTLAEVGFGSGNDLAMKQLSLDKSKVELQRAEMKYRICSDGALPIEREKARLDREQAELALKIKELDVADQIDSLNEKVHGAERAVSHLQRKLDRRKLDLERSTIFAPHDGIAVYRIMDWRGNKKPEVGEYVSPWLSPVELPNFEKMKVRTQVPESFIRLIQARRTEAGASTPGSKVRVMVKTLPDRVYSAEVTWIDGWARDRNSKLSDADIKAQGLSGVRVFDVEVELEESDPQRLREGFRATVEIPVETVKNVMSIPAAAIVERDGRATVKVMHENQIQIRVIETGVQSLDKVVVTSGLSDGDQVFVPRMMAPPPPPKKMKSLPEEPAKSAKPGRGGFNSEGDAPAPRVKSGGLEGAPSDAKRRPKKGS